MGTTTDPKDPRLGHGAAAEKGPQHERYLVLSEEERARGFVRPVRTSYKHTECGSVTRMAQAIAETYAREPKFYGSTYCMGCSGHFPVSEFTWEPDGAEVGS